MQTETQFNTITKTVTIKEPMLQLTLSIEEAKMLLALGATSVYGRKVFLEECNSPKNRFSAGLYLDQCESCSKLLSEFYFAAKAFVNKNQN